MFFGVFVWQGIMVATAAFMTAMIASVLASVFRGQGVSIIPLLVAGVVLGLGSLALILDEATLVKVYPTVVNGMLAAGIAGLQLIGHDPLRRVGALMSLSLTEQGWTRLTWRLVGYLALLALANEFVWRSFDTATWVMFKTFVILGLNAAFAASQIPLVRARWQSPRPPDRPSGD